MRRRLNIGLMIHHLDNDYSKIVLRGATAAAEDLDVNLVIYAGRSIKPKLNDKIYAAYEYQYNMLYDFASSKILDGVIISAATLGEYISKEELKKFIDGYNDMPLIVMENEVEGYPCLRFGADGIRQEVDHLINEHGCRNIGFISGSRHNTDAAARLEAYRLALEENSIEYDESLVRYGNFSEFTEEIVGDLLDNCGRKLDAICFANDQMCIGGYNAIKERGLVIGKDIYVTGYDDSDVAFRLDPMLTTVKADASKLGYSAVENLYAWIKQGVPFEGEELSASLVARESCGCKSIHNYSDRILSMVEGMSVEETASAIVNVISGNDITGAGVKSVRHDAVNFLTNVFTAFVSGGEISEAKLSEDFSEFLNKGAVERLGHDDLLNILDTSQTVAVSLCGNAWARSSKVLKVFENFNRLLAEHAMSMYFRIKSEMTFRHFLICNITKDMLLNMDNGNSSESCFMTIVNNLYRIQIKSSFIYLYPDTIYNKPDSVWEMPEKLRLKAYHIGDDLHSFNDDNTVNWYEIIDNEFTPDTRRTLVVSPLFSNEEQYGLAVFDLDYEVFPQIYSITPQISTAIRMNGLIHRLEGSLIVAQNTNNMLNRLSVSDELTGIYNRRGFYKYANDEIHNPINTGKTGVLIFADLDNLKKINDTFGHDDGDYAIRIAAALLAGGLRNSDVVARIGGDEFAALAVVNDESAAEIIPKRIKTLAGDHNARSEKEYNVTISIGLYCFKCSESVNVQDYMDMADESLYEDKKHKNPNIFKDQRK